MGLVSMMPELIYFWCVEKVAAPIQNTILISVWGLCFLIHLALTVTIHPLSTQESWFQAEGIRWLQ